MIKSVLQHEMDVLKASIDEVKKKAKKANYDPEVVYIVVNKKINSRFFDMGGTSFPIQNQEASSWRKCQSTIALISI